MPFNIGLSGLNAAATDLRVTGHNVANAGTVGFKESRAEFGDLFAASYGQISDTISGQGVKVQTIAQQFNQGNISFTQNNLDLAVSGQGFFVVENAQGETQYTRNGQFKVDSNGFIVNNTGDRLQAFDRTSDEYDFANPTFNVGQMNDIQLDPKAFNVAPQATTEIDMQVNLPARADPPINGDDFEFSDEGPPRRTTPDTDMYNFSTSVTVYDSLGEPRTLTAYFVRDEDPLNWQVYIGMLDEEGMMQQVGETQMTFDNNGQLATVNGADVGDDPTDIDRLIEIEFELEDDNGAADLVATLDLLGSTQYGSRFVIQGTNQDGFTTGQLRGVNTDERGVVFAQYTNGQNKVLGQVALANFENNQGLQEVGDNKWISTFDSGAPVYGAAQTGAFGAVQAGALESSNVDLAEQLIKLITAQRNYQANAKTIETASALSQTVMNIR